MSISKKTIAANDIMYRWAQAIADAQAGKGHRNIDSVIAEMVEEAFEAGDDNGYDRGYDVGREYGHDAGVE